VPTLAPVQELTLRLRADTAQAHRRLENGLDLMATPPSRQQIQALLERFYGFYAVFEPALPALLPPQLLAGRQKCPILARDLMGFGYGQADLDALPRCLPILEVLNGPPSALGALYVMEGSALGGKLISRMLARTGQFPRSIAYFDPYGEGASLMWQSFKAALVQASSPHTDDRLIAAANQTFAILHDWLVPTYRSTQ